MDIPNELFDQINISDLNHCPTDPRITGVTYYIRLLFNPSKTLATISELKLRREAEIKYNMTRLEINVSIENSTENTEYSDFKELINSLESWRSEREEFVGQPYFTEFEEKEKRERAKELTGKLLSRLKLPNIFKAIHNPWGNLRAIQAMSAPIRLPNIAESARVAIQGHRSRQNALDRAVTFTRSLQANIDQTKRIREQLLHSNAIMPPILFNTFKK